MPPGDGAAAMNTIIYWFSGTGNSLHAARKTAEQVRYHHPAVKPKDFMFRDE
jgi:hypothetical protein